MNRVATIGPGSFNARMALGMVPTGARTVKPIPPHLLALVPKPQGKNETIKSAGADPLRDTVPLIKRLARRQMWQGKKLAQALKGATVEETLRNDWNFIFDHIQYVKDPEGRETVRSLRRLVHDRKGDCDCFVNALGNLLLNQKIPFALRVTKYDGQPDWQHIYIKAAGYTLDPVVHQFNYEVPFTEKRDFPMTLESLDGFAAQPSAVALYDRPMRFGFNGLGACPTNTSSVTNQPLATQASQNIKSQAEETITYATQEQIDGALESGIFQTLMPLDAKTLNPNGNATPNAQTKDATTPIPTWQKVGIGAGLLALGVWLFSGTDKKPLNGSNDSDRKVQRSARKRFLPVAHI